jgi:uncharacterized damage-inducible protein DinB
MSGTRTGVPTSDMLDTVSEPFPEPTVTHESRADVLAGYIDYFRSRCIEKIAGLPPDELRRSRLPSGWTPIELLKHLTYDELRWLEWRFEGRAVGNPWGDNRDGPDGHWYVAEEETLDELTAALQAQGARSRAIIETNDLERTGAPGPGWEVPVPPTLERVVLHLIQEYARHLGHLDIVTELAGGPIGE